MFENLLLWSIFVKLTFVKYLRYNSSQVQNISVKCFLVLILPQTYVTQLMKRAVLQEDKIKQILIKQALNFTASQYIEIS